MQIVNDLSSIRFPLEEISDEYTGRIQEENMWNNDTWKLWEGESFHGEDTYHERVEVERANGIRDLFPGAGWWNRSLFTLFFFLGGYRSSRTWRWNLSNIDNIQKWFPSSTTCTFPLPLPFLLLSLVSAQTTLFLIRHRVKEDGTWIFYRIDQTVFRLWIFSSSSSSSSFIFCFTRRRIVAIFSTSRKKYNERECFVKIFFPK